MKDRTGRNTSLYIKQGSPPQRNPAHAARLKRRFVAPEAACLSRRQRPDALFRLGKSRTARAGESPILCFSTGCDAICSPLAGDGDICSRQLRSFLKVFHILLKKGGDPMAEKENDGRASNEQDQASHPQEIPVYKTQDREFRERHTSSEAEEFRVPTEYATPMKRLWAWVGVVYAVGYALLMTYAFANGEFPQGIGQLLTAPALAGLGGSVILRYREGKGRGGLPVCVALSGVSFALALWNLALGLPALLRQL